ncbi:MAG: ATP-binding protein [Cuspidothrix sp.]
MELDITRFFQACNPSKTLVMGKAEDRQYYIDFAPVRGAKVIDQLKRAIAVLSPEDPTCQLFTGHIGCGKSTELLRLKAELEQENFHVVYFESSQMLDLANVDISDILLAITSQISQSLASINIELQPGYFKQLLTEISDILQTPIDLGIEAELSLGIAKITAKAKENDQDRNKLRQYLEPRSTGILDSINKEIIKPAQEKLKKQGKKGLVIIVDGLDKIDNSLKPNNQLQPEYLFAERGHQLNSLKCHVVYTIPLVLVYSNALARIRDRFNGSPKVLPMAATKHQDGSDFTIGIELLKKMIMVRAFPDVNWDNWDDKEDLITKVFDSVDTLERLCKISGGHLRNLLSLLYSCLQNDDLPITGDSLETVIRKECNLLSKGIDNNEWQLLKDVSQTKNIAGHEEYNTLIRDLFVFEYIEKDLSWFNINPILKESSNFNL